MMKRMSNVLIALCAIVMSGCLTNQTQVNTGGGNPAQTQTSSVNTDVSVSLNFRGWYPWGGIQATPNGNTVTFNGKVGSAGYVNENLDKNLKNKTISLKIRNAAASNFSEDRMMKITVNKNDRSVQPHGVEIIQSEYIPSEYELLEFVLPPDFDGKMGFVFYQADLKSLQITMTYK